MKRRASNSLPARVGAALLSLFLPAAGAGAQTTPEDRLDPGYRSDDALTTPRETVEIDGAVAKVAPVSGPVTAITGLRFVGASVPSNVADASRDFLGRPADTDTLQQLAGAMTTAYRKSDVAFFTLAIPQQDFSDGIVDVYIAEGHIADVIVRKDGEPTERLRLRGYLQPAMDERPASRAAFERGISLARRTDGATVTPQLMTNGEAGAVVLVLDVVEKPYELALAYDSRESPLVDSGRIGVSASAFSTARRGDLLRGRLSTTPDGEQSRSASAEYKTPIGSNGLSVGVAGAWQETRPRALDLAGEASFLSASMSYPLRLDFRREISLDASVDRIESTNTALGAVLANERITAARFGAKGNWATTGRTLAAGLTWSHGLDLDEARSSVLGSDTAFDKFVANAGVVQKLNETVFLRLRATGQWTDDILPANERLMIGGAEFGRGFKNGLISFDKGYAVSIEPAWRPVRQGALARSEIYLFADHAGGSQTSDGVNSVQMDLSSAGFGTRLAYKDFASIGLEIAEPVNQLAPGLNDDPIFTFVWSLRYRPN